MNKIDEHHPIPWTGINQTAISVTSLVPTSSSQKHCASKGQMTRAIVICAGRKTVSWDFARANQYPKVMQWWTPVVQYMIPLQKKMCWFVFGFRQGTEFRPGGSTSSKLTCLQTLSPSTSWPNEVFLPQVLLKKFKQFQTCLISWRATLTSQVKCGPLYNIHKVFRAGSLAQQVNGSITTNFDDLHFNLWQTSINRTLRHFPIPLKHMLLLPEDPATRNTKGHACMNVNESSGNLQSVAFGTFAAKTDIDKVPNKSLRVRALPQALWPNHRDKTHIVEVNMSTGLQQSPPVISLLTKLTATFRLLIYSHLQIPHLYYHNLVAQCTQNIHSFHRPGWQRLRRPRGTLVLTSMLEISWPQNRNPSRIWKKKTKAPRNYTHKIGGKVIFWIS